MAVTASVRSYLGSSCTEGQSPVQTEQPLLVRYEKRAEQKGAESSELELDIVKNKRFTNFFTLFLAVWLLVGPQPCGLTHPLLRANDLVASVTGVDGTVTKVAPSLVHLPVVRVK